MGRWGDDTIRDVYGKTGGYCRYCGKKIAYVNYGNLSSRGSWEIDHSNPVSLGGTDYFRNLWPACTECNRAKGTMTGPLIHASIWRRTRPSSLPLGRFHHCDSRCVSRGHSPELALQCCGGSMRAPNTLPTCAQLISYPDSGWDLQDSAARATVPEPSNG